MAEMAAACHALPSPRLAGEEAAYYGVLLLVSINSLRSVATSTALNVHPGRVPVCRARNLGSVDCRKTLRDSSVVCSQPAPAKIPAWRSVEYFAYGCRTGTMPEATTWSWTGPRKACRSECWQSGNKVLIVSERGAYSTVRSHSSLGDGTPGTGDSPPLSACRPNGRDQGRCTTPNIASQGWRLLDMLGPLITFALVPTRTLTDALVAILAVRFDPRRTVSVAEALSHVGAPLDIPNRGIVFMAQRTLAAL
jgi:hypothetical protein